MRERPNGLLQGLELLVTVLLARNRQPPPTVAAGVPHAELAEELLTLPSGLLAMVCEAIVKLKVRLGSAFACVRLGCVGHRRGADEVRAHAQRPSRVGYGAVLTSRVSPTMAECRQYCESYLRSFTGRPTIAAALLQPPKIGSSFRAGAPSGEVRGLSHITHGTISET